ncbi:unnamed protein product, partial [Cylicostephanus goldi]
MSDDDDLTSPSPTVGLNRRNQVAKSHPALEDITHHRSSSPSTENAGPLSSKIKTKKKNATVYGLNKSKFQGYFYMEEIDDLPSTEFLEERGPVKVKESELRRSGDTERNLNTGELRTDEAMVVPRQQVKVKESELRRSGDTERNLNKGELRTDEAMVVPRQQ